MQGETDSLGGMISGVSEKWNALTPPMIQMGIIEELLHRKLVLCERDVPSFAVTITPQGFEVEEGSDPFAHADTCDILTDARRRKILDTAMVLEDLGDIGEFTALLA